MYIIKQQVLNEYLQTSSTALLLTELAHRKLTPLSVHLLVPRYCSFSLSSHLLQFITTSSQFYFPNTSLTHSILLVFTLASLVLASITSEMDFPSGCLTSLPLHSPKVARMMCIKCKSDYVTCYLQIPLTSS